MKQAVVPAQVTTIEDRIAGNLNLSQLLLLVAPIFIGSLLYFALPPIGHPAIYKFVMLAMLFLLCGILAIRIKGKIVLFWIIILASYNVRPRYYLFNKQSQHGRELLATEKLIEEEVEVEEKATQARQPLSLSTADMLHVRSILDNPASNLRFENRKGNLYVRITEIKQEG